MAAGPIIPTKNRKMVFRRNHGCIRSICRNPCVNALSQSVILKGVVADAKTKKPLAATVELIDLKTNQMISRVQADAQTGPTPPFCPAVANTPYT